jgi:hypothetical protein
MRTTQETKKLRAFLHKLLQQTQDALKEEKSDKRKTLFLKLMAALTESAALHFELQQLESKDRFNISKQSVKRLRNTHHKALGMFVKIPPKSNSSLYEMCTILAIADVIAAHSESESSGNDKASKRIKGS